ncbi:MAG: dTMP kinase [Thermaerobacter sp.]|nr:dTMP kinase [Thermaerobacter sp.]
MTGRRGGVWGLIPGQLIVGEGCDGSGKTTQLQLLRRWLIEQGAAVYWTAWNSSEAVHPRIREAKRRRRLTPLTYSLLHACDFAARYEEGILPHLQAGWVVLADRYVFTAYARDGARGCKAAWVRGLYGFAARPDLVLYFRASPETGLQRVLARRSAPRFYEAGMDLGLSEDPSESFRLYQGRVRERYDRLLRGERTVVIDADTAAVRQQERVRAVVGELLGLPGAGEGRAAACLDASL